MKLKHFSLIACAILVFPIANAQTEDQVLEAWKDGNYTRLLEYHTTADSSLLPMIEDALVLVPSNLEQLDYSRLENLYNNSTNDSLVMNLIVPVFNDKKRQIIAQLYTLYI